MTTLEEAVSSANLVVVVGTGISKAASGGAACASWAGLVQCGIERVDSLCPPDSDWREIVEQLLRYGKRSQTTQPLLSAASMVSAELRKIGAQTYADWLSNSLGAIKIVDSSVLAALGKMPFPILTTNYDTLLEEATGRPTTVWSDGKGLQEILTGTSRAIGHLHGVWNRPETVIFSEFDYARLAADKAAQHLERAISSTTSLLYVGFGAGLDDPNFSRVREWYGSLFPVSGVDHFRLCLSSETEDLQRQHATEAIRPVSYGEKHGDLGGFLRRLVQENAPAKYSEVGIARDAAADAQESLAAELVEDLVICEGLTDMQAVSLDAVILPPILLPVPHAEFVKARSKRGKGTSVERIDGEQDVSEAEYILLVGDDEAGLTTALKWMAWKAARNLGNVAPLYVNFKECTRRKNPLADRLRAAARAAGLLERRGAELPPYVVAIDDMSPYVERVSEGAIADVASCRAFVVILGCKQGHENDLVSKLAGNWSGGLGLPGVSGGELGERFEAVDAVFRGGGEVAA